MNAPLLSRRALFGAGLGAAALAALPGCAARGTRPALGFKPVPPSSEDRLVVPEGYEARVLYRWGDPVGSPSGMPAFRMDASNSAEEQALQAGMHHDGMHYFPIDGSRHGLLAMNHEYVDQGLLYPDGMRTWTADKVSKALNASGVSVIEVRLQNGQWTVVRPSRSARRVTSTTPCRVAGPAGGHRLMRTAANPDGRLVLGTNNGCAHGWTPWGTFLTCEENWHMLFANGGAISAEQKRYRLAPRGYGYRWHEFEERFDAARHPNEFHRFGWVVEIDPYDPQSIPVKRTAMGRFAHEGAACAVGADRRLAFYMGDDAAGEYLYKFVPAGPWDPAVRENNRDLLNDGMLYAARFNADGSGQWLALDGPDAGAQRIFTRLAADAAGATKMDRPEWVVPHPANGEVYAALTGSRANRYGSIIRWKEDGGDVAATRFRWETFVRAGPAGKGEVKGDAFANPDGLWIDSLGTLWVQTDVSALALGRGEFAPLGNNQLLAADPATGVFRRFLTGPRGCEITAFHTTPDNRSAFVNIQHPGETPGGFSDPDAPGRFSHWPDYEPQGRPRSATVVIRRKDGDVIGA